MRFQLIDAGTEEFPLPEPVQGSRGEPERRLRLAEPPCLSATARGPRAAGPCPLGLRALERDLRQPAHDARTAGHRPRRRPPSDGPADARERVARAAAAPLQAHDRQPARLPGRPQPDRAGLLDRAPRREGGADISSIGTREGWLYRAVVMDLFARRVVGWAVSDRLHKELALAALRRALVVRRPEAGLLHHSDRGSPYCSIEYQAELRKHGVLISMSGKGNGYDNSMVETFFKTLKSELVWRTAFQTRAEASQALARYIDGFYNPVRRHSALDFVSPAQFERRTSQSALH